MLDLEDELEQVEGFGDGEGALRIKVERDFLVRELASAMGLGATIRTTGSAPERARVNVTRAIRTSIERIRTQSPALGDHLEAAVHTGIFCSYTPDPRTPTNWQL